MGKSFATRNELVLRHQALVGRVARQIHARLPAAVELDDLQSVGTLGLLDALARYNPSRGVPFDSYARHRIRGAILDALRGVDWVPHSVRRKAQAIERARQELIAETGAKPNELDIAARLGVGLEEFHALARDAELRAVVSLDSPATSDSLVPLIEQVDSGSDLEAAAAHRELGDRVVDAISELPEREAAAVQLYYLEDRPLKEVGTTLGVTESRACQLCGQGIKRLRRRLQRAA